MANRGWLVAGVLAVVLVTGCKKSNEPAAAGSAAGSGTAVSGSAAGSAVVAAATPVDAGVLVDAATADPNALKVGDRVMGAWTPTDWYPGKIDKINDDGTYRVKYDDGDVSPSLTAKQVRRRGGGGGGGAKAAAGAKPCNEGAGWTRCPVGDCFRLDRDNQHCGSCSHSCGGMASCRDSVCVPL